MEAELGEENLSGECSCGVCVSRAHLRYFSCVPVISMFRNVNRVQITEGCHGGGRGH